MTHIDIVFDRLPDADGANFVEVEDASGASIKIGEWVTRPDGYVALRVPDQTILADASSVPEPGVSPSNAAEFAALWNTRTPEQREKLVQVLLDQQSSAHKCFMEDHEGLKQQLGVAQQIITKVQAYANDRRAHARSRNNTLSSWRVWSDLVGILGTHPASNRWDTEQKHQDCVPCEEAVELAIETAQQKGENEATWKVMTPVTKPDGSFGGTAEHVGTVKRSA